jgi:hypothetical protein
MTISVHIGVLDIPYSARMSSREVRTYRWLKQKKPWEGISGQQTTGDVAQILENKYGIFRTYFEEMHPDLVPEVLTQAMQNKLEALMSGAPAAADSRSIFADLDLSPIEEAFKRAIERQEFDGIVSGVPTKASLKGINHRLKHPYAKDNPQRPSFMDTNLFHGSIKAWMD